MPARKLSTSEAEQLRAFERQGHDALAATYQEFFAPVTAIAIAPLLDAVGLRPGTLANEPPCASSPQNPSEMSRARSMVNCVKSCGRSRPAAIVEP